MKSVLTKEIIKRRFGEPVPLRSKKENFGSSINHQLHISAVNNFAAKNVANPCKHKSFPDPYISYIQFLAWQNNTVAEMNRNVWLQFWIATDVCDYICVVVDSRNVGFFFEEELLEMGKPVILIMNKYDLCNGNVPDDNNFFRNRFKFVDRIFKIFKFSNVDQHVNIEFLEFLKSQGNRKYAMIGYPNVGKSSLIKTISNHVKIKISSTPGKTKFVQSYQFTDILFLDVPGLVFKRHSREELLIYNIINVDQSKIDYEKLFELLLQKISMIQIIEHFKIKLLNTNCTLDELLAEIVKQRKWAKERFFRKLLKDFFEGKIMQK
ncbi:putative GTP-binding protein MMR1 [Trachipleistophora hominis]|uniref:Putative GTP-binding protein MMR1 n=1 Tax=Trachipleistophora hominis TaxID=72359 RepID=L7JUH5_TRAHO|nr:putative GTP-binding protein MMR1 [Trachipleistophora hominis]